MRRILSIFTVSVLLLTMHLQACNAEARGSEAQANGTVKMLLINIEDPDLAAENTDVSELSSFVKK